MENSSLSRRRLLGGGLLAAGAAFVFEACGESPLASREAAAKPISFGSPYRLQVKQAIHVFSPHPLTPLQALQISKIPYEVVVIGSGKFVTSVKNSPDLWVFMVDGAMPDLSGASVVTRLGKVAINSPEEARSQLPRFRSGTIGLSLATAGPSGASGPTAETVFFPAPAPGRVLISWLQAGLLQPDVV